MAVFLIIGDSVPERGPTEVRYGPGDIVAVYDDAKPLVIPPAAPFWLIKLTGLSVADAQEYVAAWTEPDLISSDPEATILRKKRRYAVGLSALPTPIINTLRRDGYIERAWSVVGPLIVDKMNG